MNENYGVFGAGYGQLIGQAQYQYTRMDQVIHPGQLIAMAPSLAPSLPSKDSDPFKDERLLLCEEEGL